MALLDDYGLPLRPFAGWTVGMIKSQLVLRIAERSPHLYNKDAAKVVNAIFDEIKAALVRRDRVEVRGFGIFTIKTRSARPGRNPKTRASINVPETHFPSFRMAKEMRDRLNGALGSVRRAPFHKS
jgi:integration host factor subunit beta